MRVSGENWLQSQYSVLGSMMLAPEMVPMVLTETSEQDFSGPCLTVYETVRKLFDAGQAVDIVSVNAALGGQYQQFLIQLMEITPSAANIAQYIRLCKEQSRMLAIGTIGDQLASATTLDETQALLEQANKLLAVQSRRKVASMADSLRVFMDKPNVKTSYLSWPLRDFDERIYSGSGDFIILGAEPSVGKTAFALQCAWHWARTKKVGFFSFETSPEKLFDRLMAMVVGIPLSAIKNNAIAHNEWDRVCQAVGEITERKLDLISAAGMKTADIRASILESGYELVIIDYLQLITTKGASRYEQVTNISIDLHNMAQSMGVTIMALSQLSRSDEDRAPKNSDLRESGQLEQDADVIIMLKLENQSKPSGPRKLFVTKNKEGELFMTILEFDGKHQRFSKASRTSEVVSKMQADGKRARAKNRMAAQDMAQLSILPSNTAVPFEE